MQIKTVLHELARLQVAYRWAHTSGYGVAVTGDGGRRSGVSDPTGNLAASQTRERLRYACRKASEDLTEALDAVRSAQFTLDRAMTAVEPQPSANLRHEDQYRVSRAELAASKQAQERRTERGEGYGET